ncbi:hypothetical protein RI367_008497, partial [Sorochytrium milnesiophthora]
MHMQGVDVVLLQETKLTTKRTRFIDKSARDEWVSFWACDDARPQGAGVGVLLRRHLASRVCRLSRCGGYGVTVTLAFRRRLLRVTNVYAPPNNARVERALAAYLIEETRRDSAAVDVVVGGDLNAAACPAMDRAGGVAEASEGRLHPWLSDNALIDSWRQQHPDAQEYTFEVDRDGAQHRSRIDYIYLSPTAYAR